MARTQNSFLKNQRAKQKKQKRDAKLDRKHDKKNKAPEDIHDMSNLNRPEELGFLPEEEFVGPNVKKVEPKKPSEHVPFRQFKPKQQ